MSEKNKKNTNKNKKNTTKINQNNKTTKTKKQLPVKGDVQEHTKELAPVIEKLKEEKQNDKSSHQIKMHDKTKEPRKKSSPVRNDEFTKLIKIVLIVTAIMAVFYVITIVVTNKADETKNSATTDESQNEKAVIQYENIIIGNMLNKSGTYYVLIEMKNDNRATEYDSLVKTIESSDDAPTIYKANLTDSFNKGYLGKESNYYVTDISEFKVTGTSLVKINNGKIDSVYDNYDAIKNKLNELS